MDTFQIARKIGRKFFMKTRGSRGSGHAIAGRAPRERRAALAHPRRQSILHVGLGHGLERRVAAEAAGEGPDGAREVEPFDDLAQLRARVGRPDAIAARDGAAHQEHAIACEEHAPLAGGRGDQRRIAGVPVVARVDARDPQVGGEPS